MLNTDQGNLEIARYITPYRIACGPWTVDITDFKSLITGRNEYTSFVSVFGPTGWEVTLDMEFISGTGLQHSKIPPLWTNDYVIYGDPGISHDLDPYTVTSEGITEESHIRMHVTGHGQGNTSNAAEFFEVTHQLQVDGNTIADHHLWKDDCASNPCTNQQGTYLFSRAGWCPGQEVIPAFFPTTEFISAGADASIDYELQDYVNRLNTGYNNSGHTEPHYRLHGYFVENSSMPYRSYTNLVAESIEIEGQGQVEGISLTITNNGTEPVVGFDASFYLNGELIVTEPVDLELRPGASYTHNFQELTTIGTMGRYDFYGEVTTAIDETPGDNLVSTSIDFGSSTFDETVLNKINIFPNPSSGTIQLDIDETLKGGILEISTVDGKLILRRGINQLTTRINDLNPGTLIVKFIDTEGNFASQKLIVLD